MDRLAYHERHTGIHQALAREKRDQGMAADQKN
jgi:hypothetical protein